ncbi:hypothetical protein Taro_056816, partial [Colocasia esculenta]|nr:hypothetical protein [Colocasia esculenta]
ITHFCHGGVDTPLGGADTGSESLKQFHENRVHCVDTVLGSVDTSPRFQKIQLPDWDSSVDTSPRFQKTQLPDWDSVSTQSQACRHTPAETQNRGLIWTRGRLGFKGFDLGFRAHAPQGTLWTYGAINTHALCTPKAREPTHFLKNLFGG